MPNVIRMMMAAAGGGAAAGPVAITLTASPAVNGAAQSSYTFSSVALGSAAAGRVIVVGTAGGDAGGTVTSMTVGGVSASNIISVSPESDSNYNAELWLAVVPTGTTGDVVVNWSATMARGMIGVWAVTGANSTPHASASDGTAAGGYIGSLNVEADGGIIAYAWQNSATGGIAFTGATETFEVVQGGGGDLWRHAGANDDYGSAQTPQVISVTFGGGGRDGILTVSFSPA